MPTNQTVYNTRLTDEALEKRFRDTFRSQGGAELVDDLYAQGVIVPVVDFTAAAEGNTLRQDLQTAWDFSTQSDTVQNTTTNLTSTPGFWKVDLTFNVDATGGGRVQISDGISTPKVVWDAKIEGNIDFTVTDGSFVVFLRSGDTLQALTDSSLADMRIWYRQIADVNGNIVNPLGFTSS